MDIFVGKLPDTASLAELKNMFKGFDKQATFKIKRMRGREGRLTYGLVSIPSERLARKAIKRLHMKKFMGRSVCVREYSFRAAGNDRRQLGWRRKLWLGQERRQIDRRDSKSEKENEFDSYAA